MLILIELWIKLIQQEITFFTPLTFSHSIILGDNNYNNKCENNEQELLALKFSYFSILLTPFRFKKKNFKQT